MHAPKVKPAISLTNGNASQSIVCQNYVRFLTSLMLTGEGWMQPSVRKIVIYDEEVFIEGFKSAS